MKERDLYEPIASWLESPQFPSRNVDPNGPRILLKRVAITAETDWLQKSVRWMRPDLCAVVISRGRYDPVPSVDVYAIEVKSTQRELTEAVFQTLSYSRIADYCLLAAPSNSGWTEQTFELASQFGIGHIRFENEKIWDQYLHTPGERMSPDARLRQQFLDAAFPSALEQKDIQHALGFGK